MVLTFDVFRATNKNNIIKKEDGRVGEGRPCPPERDNHQTKQITTKELVEWENKSKKKTLAHTDTHTGREKIQNKLVHYRIYIYLLVPPFQSDASTSCSFIL